MEIKFKTKKISNVEKKIDINTNKKSTWEIIKGQKTLILMAIPFIIYVAIFCYAPLAGWVMAFQNYKPGKGVFDQIWVGFEQFKFLFSDDVFLKVLRNTLAMSLINLSLGFICSIGLALILNEVRNRHAKKFVQTVSYLPHFLSWIVVTGIVAEVLSPSTGVVNEILKNMNLVDNPINFFADPKYFWGIVGATNVWKEVGWGSIIYLAAMTSINTDLYEAAEIDGAGRLQKIWHVTLPGIKPTIFILLIINIGNILNAGFEIQYLLGNGLIQDVSQTIDIFVLKYGIGLNNYSLATAAGIFKSVISIILIFIANKAAKSAGQESLF
ncbi:MAG: ABC transporter permease [Clostridium saudiense]|uniref:Carbohydrate ABC transporter membrane protein 1, CUT1 family n=1 Tax=Clostridium disporicum TaxID=84024 RepID=A0A174GCU2_9CLOT|nr:MULTISPECIES: ABC transporter permease subunit [Clostridium]CUO58968.1 carbohydrate ABC transporter membrane protein 1%2C CUT1 family [Clostridium disporicum]